MNSMQQWLDVILWRHILGQTGRVGVVGSYTGTRLHGVSQITHKIAGVVFSLITACQLSQALRGHKNQHLLLRYHD